MRGRDLIEVAARLGRGRPPAEPFARSAVSRAYYAAFGELSAYLRARSYAPPATRNSHDAAWNHLKSHIPDSDVRRQAERRAIADTGLLLKSHRQKADYQLTARLAATEAQDAVRDANRIISGLDRLDAALGPP